MGLLPRGRWRVTSDAVDLDGTDLAALTESGMRRVRGRQMSMIFQEPMTALDPVFRVGNQLGAVFRRHSGESGRRARSSAGAMLERVGFGDPPHVLSSYPHQLSGGMRQRVMIAMAMACRPKVLIADEPTTALDVTTQAQVLEQLTALARSQNTAILLITHDLGVVAQYCDRALVMLEGAIVEDAPVAELFSRPRHDYTRHLLSFSATETGS
jgi:ABC-type dipeptide/oligopeptide/nickel transport system ATPase component